MNLNRKELFISQLLSSDSSSDDEDYLTEIVTMLVQEFPPKRRKCKQTRTLQSNEQHGKTKCDTQFPDSNIERNRSNLVDLDHISDKQLATHLSNWKEVESEEFCKLFRLSKLCFEVLLEMFENFPAKLLPTEKRSKMLLIFLIFAGHQISLKSLAQKINIYRSTCGTYIDFVLEFLFSLKDTVFGLPKTLEEKQRIAEDFFNIASLKNVIGCIEKISFTYNPQCGNVLRNNNTKTCFAVEIICDASGRFLANETEMPDSLLAKYSESNYCFLGSLNYSLREWLIIPCQEDDLEPAAALNADQELFNEKFRNTYKVLLQSIVQLRERFAQLKCIDTNRVMFARRFLLACIILHNVALNCNNHWQVDDVDNILCPIITDPTTNSIIKSKLEHFKSPKGLMKRDHMIYESCNFDVVDIIEQEIEVE